MLDSEIKVFILLSRVGFGLGTNLFRDCSIVVMNRVMSLCYAQEYGGLIHPPPRIRVKMVIGSKNGIVMRVSNRFNNVLVCPLRNHRNKKRNELKILSPRDIQGSKVDFPMYLSYQIGIFLLGRQPL